MSFSTQVVVEAYPFLEAKFTTLELMKGLWLPTSVIKGTHSLAMFDVRAIVMVTGTALLQNVYLVSKLITHFVLMLDTRANCSGFN